jgi:hypothetical protein
MRCPIRTLILCHLLPLALLAAAEPAPSRAAAIDASKFPSLQAALDALPDAGGMVVLPPGTFEITQPLVLSRGEARLDGAGASTHIINKNTNGLPALIVRAKDRAAGRKGRLWRVQLGNFRLSGNTNSGDGVLAVGIDEIFIHGLSVDRHGGHGVNLVDCYEDPRIADSIFTYNGLAGVNICAGHDIVVSANHFEENLDALVCTNSFNLCMNGNNIDDHLRHGVVIENTYGSVLSGNMIEECNGTAIILDRDCYGITISANVIAHDLGGGVDLRDAWGCAVSANTFVLVHTNAVVVGPASGRITISGNSFCNSHVGGGLKRATVDAKTPMQRDAGSGVRLAGASDVTVVGNTFSGLDGQAVVGDGGCQRVVVANNVMVDLCQREAKPKPAIDLGKARQCVVKDNVVQPVVRPPAKKQAAK